jgi:hypothetical protein
MMVVVIVAAACVTSLGAVGTWVLLTDPEIAAEVSMDGPWPLARAILVTLGRALVSVLAYL